LVHRRTVAVLLAAALVGGCQGRPAAPGPAEMRAGAPPWDAPRDAVSYIDAAGLERLPLDFRGPEPYAVRVVVTVDGAPVTVPGGLGVDLRRAEQAPLHTHGTDGWVHVEARTEAARPTLSQLFVLWGVRYDARCLGAACGGVKVTVDGAPATWDTALRPSTVVAVAAESVS
jgi:hypothetical protein